MKPALSISSGRAVASVDSRRGQRRAAKVARASGELAGGKPGLVHASYPHRPSVSATTRGSLVEVKYPPCEQERKPGKRGKVTEFSRSARWRMRKFLATLDRDEMPVLVGLTYPEEFPRSPSIYKEHLRRFTIRLGRELAGLGGTWKLEFQDRGAAHYHLLIWGLEGSKRGGRVGTGRVKQEVCHTRKEFREWVSRAWYEVVGSGDEKHLRAGTNVQRIRSPNGVQAYVAGYASKDDQTLHGEEVGKYWGKFHVEHLPVCEVEPVEIAQDSVNEVVRTLRKARMAKRKEGWRRQVARSGLAAKPKKGRAGSFTYICDARQWVERIPEIVAARVWFVRERRRVHTQEGWHARPKRSEGMIRPDHRPNGPSYTPVQAARRLSALRPKPSSPLPTPEKGVESIGASDASGGLPVRPFMWEFPRRVRSIGPEAAAGSWEGDGLPKWQAMMAGQTWGQVEAD